LKFEAGAVANHGNLFFKLCSDHLSIEAIPRKAAKIDLERLRDRSFSGFELMLWTSQFVVLRNRDGHEITLRRDGRMIIRKAPSEQVAERAANEIMSVISRRRLV
jgi:hypothetical protein